MELKELKKHWDAMGRQDPMWAIQTSQNKRGRKWDREEFFATGRRHIDGVMAYIGSLATPPRRKALDFGCGIGRLTQALCRYYDEGVGVDIAPSMIEKAQELNRFGEKCRYFVNDNPDLRLFGDATFDLVYSVIVLQHINPTFSRRYIEEFVRVLAPGGIALFQVPSNPRPPRVEPAEPSASSRHRAEIELLDAPRSARAGQEIEVRARVTNLGDWPWPAEDQETELPVRLANHWLDAAGNMLVYDDGRAPLPREVPPSGRIDLTLKVHLPNDLGAYTLELDMVQELVTWFKDKGSRTVQCQVAATSPFGPLHRVGRRVESAVRSAADNLRFVPIQEMHVIPRTDVVALLQANGGVVLDIREDNWAGSSWVSYTYCVTKESSAGR